MSLTQQSAGISLVVVEDHSARNASPGWTVEGLADDMGIAAEATHPEAVTKQHPALLAALALLSMT